MSDKRIVVAKHNALSHLFPLAVASLPPYIYCLAIVCAVLVNLSLSPQYLALYVLIRNHVHALQLLPPVTSLPFAQRHAVMAPFNTIRSVRGAFIFAGSFVLVFVLYFWAIRSLPARVSYRYIVVSTALMGGVYVLIPVLTSQDVISYTAYARMFVLYHFNPLVTAPVAIRHDYVYHFLYWVHQPSVYGPVWIGITGLLQWLALLLGFKYVLSMQMLLRLFGLVMHLGSTYLVWLISGRLCALFSDADDSHTLRIRATLAFAWNPFLLLEACVNAHNDVTILFLLLLSFWFLLPRPGSRRPHFLLAALFLALAACTKITYLLLLPGLLLFLLTRQDDVRVTLTDRLKDVLLAAGVYFGLLVGLHAPFWSHGALLHVLKNAPSVSRDINSFYDLAVNVYTGVTGASLKNTTDAGSHIEVVSHYVSGVLFICGYGLFCGYTLLKPRYVRTLTALIGWMAFVWLFYCVVGDPWFWPWYLIIGVGCFAVLESVQGVKRDIPFTFGGHLDIALLSRWLTIGMFGLYCLRNFYDVFPRYHYHAFSSMLIWVAPLLILGLAASRFYREQGLLKDAN